MILVKLVSAGLICIIAVGICSHIYRRRRKTPRVTPPEEIEELSLPDDFQGTVKRTHFRGKPRARKGLTGDTWNGRALEQPLLDEEGEDDSAHAKAEEAAAVLELEVIEGPSKGMRLTKKVDAEARVSVSLGRMPQNDLHVNDPEVSGKHAVIAWHPQMLCWQLRDLGSLNGTEVNSKPVSPLHAPIGNGSTGARPRSEPVGLSNGDVIQLGSVSRIRVKVSVGSSASRFSVDGAPFGVGVAADAMKAGRGGKELPMEDVSLCEWPIRGTKEFGIFCIFDGHCGRVAAEAASRLMTDEVSRQLSVKETRAQVIANQDAREVLLRAFTVTEEKLTTQDQGCTATVLLIWMDPQAGLFAQCGNVGDSACFFSVDGRQVDMSEDHRCVNPNERQRLAQDGYPLKENETRIFGFNLARALGDKFAKSQGMGLIARPFVSPVLRLGDGEDSIAVIASDGLWDVLSGRRALQLTTEWRDLRRMAITSENSSSTPPATAMAELLVAKARSGGTKDNTTVVVLDFGSHSGGSSAKTL